MSHLLLKEDRTFDMLSTFQVLCVAASALDMTDDLKPCARVNTKK